MRAGVDGKEVFYRKICLKEGEVWRKVFQTKLLSRLSHKVLPSSCCVSSLITDDWGESGRLPCLRQWQVKFRIYNGGRVRNWHNHFQKIVQFTDYWNEQMYKQKLRFLNIWHFRLVSSKFCHYRRWCAVFRLEHLRRTTEHVL